MVFTSMQEGGLGPFRGLAAPLRTHHNDNLTLGIKQWPILMANNVQVIRDACRRQVWVVVGRAGLAGHEVSGSRLVLRLSAERPGNS